MMGSTSASGGVDSLSGRERIVVVGKNRRNVTLLTDTLEDYSVSTVTSPEQLNPVFSGGLPAGLVIVDTDTVSDDVSALVRTLLDEQLSVVLLAKSTSPRLREMANKTNGLTFCEKPLRSSNLLSVVGEELN